MKLELIEIKPCTEQHPVDGERCERPAPHFGLHWYTEFVDGKPSHPIFWGEV